MDAPLHVPEAQVVVRTTDHTSSAVAHLVSYIRDAPASLGLNASAIKTNRIVGDDGVASHTAFVPAPANGFNEEQGAALELYARSLTFWRNLNVDFEWGSDGVRITFRRSEKKDTAEASEKLDWRERFRSRDYKAARAIGKALAAQAFMMREPATVSMITLDKTFKGVALMVKYPYARVKDQIGIEHAYDKWVPMLADVYAREYKIRAETVREHEFTTIFFTSDPGYVSSVYDRNPRLRMITPRGFGKKGMPFWGPATFRACRALAKAYSKYFTTAVKPIPAWGASGHSMVLRYKPGAGGKIADDSYFENVRMRAEKLMKHYHVLGMIRHQPENRIIVVTFFTGAPTM